MSINTNFRVAVLNLAGSVGKTTTSRVLLKMRMPNANLIAIETANTDGKEKENGSLVRAEQFDHVHLELMSSMSAIIDIGSSNIIETIQIMQQMESSDDDIDYFVIPVVKDEKMRRDSVKTIQELLKLGVDPSKIKPLFNRVSLTDDVEEVFADFIYALKKLGVSYNPDAVVRESRFFSVFERTGMSLDDFKNTIMAKPLEENKKRQNELRCKPERTKEEQQEFQELLSLISTQQLAIAATRNLDKVFYALFQEQVIDDEESVEA